MTTIELSAWTHPCTGKVRYYIPWEDHLMDIDRYNSGNIRDAAWLDEGISNNQARALLQCKAYLDGANHLRVTYVENTVVTEDEFYDAVHDLIADAELIK